MSNRILELYSGIGGMHCAWNESGLQGDIITAVDVNTVANEVYRHNFPSPRPLTRNIQSLTPAEINKLDINTILMSPPCQPFSRNGKFLDENDPRTNSFVYLIGILQELNKVEYILMENVKGFECSNVRNLFIEKLLECNFNYQEFLLCPSAVGVPNSRLRYYCIARRTTDSWNFKRKEKFMHTLPNDYSEPFALDNILENDVSEGYLMPRNMLKRAYLLDICHKDSTRSCCFTKAYTHYVEGTGSVFTPESPELVQLCFEKAKCFEPGSDEFIAILSTLKLRYFTPQEVRALMSFPKDYSFPKNITRKQCYRLLGNSVNVKVISELLKILFMQ